MIKKILFIVLCSVQLVACATTAPQQAQTTAKHTPAVTTQHQAGIDGDWESTGPFSYFLLELKGGSGQLAVVSGRDKVILFELTEMKQVKGIHYMHFVGVKNRKKTLNLAGKLMFDHLYLRELAKSGIKVWFVRTTDLPKYRRAAEAAMHKSAAK